MFYNNTFDNNYLNFTSSILNDEQDIFPNFAFVMDNMNSKNDIFSGLKNCNFDQKDEIESMLGSNNEEENEEEEKFSTSVGTKLFSSPEQATSENYDYRTDIYSLGMVIALLFSVFTTAHHERDLLDKMRKRNLDGIILPPALKALLLRCLGPEQERPSLDELQRCLKEQLKPTKERKVRSDSPLRLERRQGRGESVEVLMIESR